MENCVRFYKGSKRNHIIIKFSFLILILVFLEFGFLIASIHKESYFLSKVVNTYLENNQVKVPKISEKVKNTVCEFIRIKYDDVLAASFHQDSEIDNLLYLVMMLKPGTSIKDSKRYAHVFVLVLKFAGPDIDPVDFKVEDIIKDNKDPMDYEIGVGIYTYFVRLYYYPSKRKIASGVKDTNFSNIKWVKSNKKNYLYGEN